MLPVLNPASPAVQLPARLGTGCTCQEALISLSGGFHFSRKASPIVNKFDGGYGGEGVRECMGKMEG